MKRKLYEKIFMHRSDDIFLLNENVYLININDYILYLDNDEGISEFFNLSMKFLFLLFDGKRTLVEVYEKFQELFETINDETFLIDFMNAVNLMERIGVIVSKKSIDRVNLIKIHKKKVFNKYLSSLKNMYKEELNV